MQRKREVFSVTNFDHAFTRHDFFFSFFYFFCFLMPKAIAARLRKEEESHLVTERYAVVCRISHFSFLFDVTRFVLSLCSEKNNSSYRKEKR